MHRSVLRVADQSKWPGRIGWAYAALIAAAAAFLWFTGDRWWFGTLLCFGPRWVLVIPLPCLAVAVVRWRRLLLPCAIASLAAFVWLGPCMSWSLTPLSAAQTPFRVATFNVGGARGDVESFARWARFLDLDAVFVQEADGERLHAAFGPDWHLSPGEGGVLVASRHRILGAQAMRPLPSGARCDVLCVDLDVNQRLVRVGCVHLPTPRSGFESLLHRSFRFIGDMASERRTREDASARARDFLVREQGADVIAGDFNLPAESAIFQAHWGDHADAFSAAGWGLGHTKFTRWHGVRIDHVLVGNPSVGVVRAFVGPDFDSDHRPVFAELAMPLSRK